MIPTKHLYALSVNGTGVLRSGLTAPRTHSLAKAQAVLTDMAGGMSGKDAAAKHDVSDTWANSLVNRPPPYVRDASWYRALAKAIKALRAKRGGTGNLVMSGRRT